MRVVYTQKISSNPAFDSAPTAQRTSSAPAVRTSFSTSTNTSSPSGPLSGYSDPACQTQTDILRQDINSAWFSNSQGLSPAPSSAPIQTKAVAAAASHQQERERDRQKENESLTSSTRSLAPSKRNHQPRSLAPSLAQSAHKQDNAVMNETLSVINEHITDLSSPRHSLIPQDSRGTNDSASEYSLTADPRRSYLAGPETDEEEDEEAEMLSQANVSKWTPQQTAAYLRRIGVDSKHCDIFEEQEISGDVLLEMDQEFIHMKEYDFGVMGKRLRTWHKVREIQEQVKQPKQGRKQVGPYTPASLGKIRPDSGATTTTMNINTTILPRIPSLSSQSETSPTRRSVSYDDRHSEHVPAPLQTQSFQSLRDRSFISTTSSVSGRRVSSQGSASRPSAASIREMGHHRQASSIGTPNTTDMRRRSPGAVETRSAHLEPVDQAGSTNTPAPISDTSQVATAAAHTGVAPATPRSAEQYAVDRAVEDPGQRISVRFPATDMDRGYLSGPESGTHKPRNTLRKRDGSDGARHSRQSSAAIDQQYTDQGTVANTNTSTARHSRYGSADSIRDIAPSVASPAAQTYHRRGLKGRLRAATARSPQPVVSPSKTSNVGALSPAVTKLEGFTATISSPSPRADSDASGSSSPRPKTSGKSSALPKRFGFRAVSDGVGGQNQDLEMSSATSIPSSSRDTPPHSPAPTGASTPSATPSKGSDRDRVDAVGTTTLTQQKDVESASGFAISAPTSAPISGKSTPRIKAKHETSAYTKGLEQISPAEQRLVCDYSGWMKKKSSSLMTTWKPRLFFLRGRRLSYYYSEIDTQERGVIDISSHKVLRAEHDTMTNLHATITGANSMPIAPSTSAKTSSFSSSLGGNETVDTGNASSSRNNHSGPFLFKLVPPKAGLPRAVQFTKPTVHYFQVDTIQEGRRWMAAMMKATIDFDPAASGLETTNQQPTISLAKARARKERLPGFESEQQQQQQQQQPQHPPPPPPPQQVGLDAAPSNPNLDGHPVLRRTSEDAGLNITGLSVIRNGQDDKGSTAADISSNREDYSGIDGFVVVADGSSSSSPSSGAGAGAGAGAGNNTTNDEVNKKVS